MAEEQNVSVPEIRSGQILRMLSEEQSVAPVNTVALVNEMILLGVHKDMVNALSRITIPRVFDTLLDAVIVSAREKNDGGSIVWILDSVPKIKDVPNRLTKVVDAIIELCNVKALGKLMEVSQVIHSPRLRMRLVRAIVLAGDSDLMGKALEVSQINSAPNLMKALRTLNVEPLTAQITEWDKMRV